MAVRMARVLPAECEAHLKRPKDARDSKRRAGGGAARSDALAAARLEVMGGGAARSDADAIRGRASTGTSEAMRERRATRDRARGGRVEAMRERRRGS
ncbi:MAG TPA: hypothetical protein RMG45_23375, partial [Polyangiaceae bacterium LLY-WYZ-15_(1-7)]|nr:hypothetical protein [Polyangiaceae bacterium LLY-WYZ-15_(1-7)]